MVEFPPEIMVDAILIFSCLLLSAFFSASETAITALGPLKTKHLIESSEQKCKHLQLWLEYPGRVLTTILIFNNLVNIFISVLATKMAIFYFESAAIGVATGVATFMILIFGEVIPKSFAKANSEPLALISLKIVRFIYRLSYPLVWCLSSFASFIIRSLGGNPNTAARPTITEEELEFMINESESSGVLEEAKKDMISGVFDFDETKVREIMMPRTDMTIISKKTTFEEAVKLAIETGYSRIPVYEDRIDNVVGVLFAKDLLRLATENNGNKTLNIEKIMRESVFVPESKSIMSVFKELKRSKNHMAIVIDEHGGTAGLVTMEDMLEEIVGEIQDEFDTEEAKILEIDKGIYDVAGSMNISEFLEYFDMDEDSFGELEQDVDTMAGLLTQMLEEMPKVGQGATLGPFNIEVSEISRHRIRRLRVVKNVEEEQPSEAHEAVT